MMSDFVIHDEKHLFGLPPVSRTELPKPLNVLASGRNEGVICYVNGVTLGKHLRRRAGCQGNHRSVSPPDLQGGGRDWRLNQSLMANDLINCVCVIKPPQPPPPKKDSVCRPSRLVSKWGSVEEGWRLRVRMPHTLSPYLELYISSTCCS